MSLVYIAGPIQPIEGVRSTQINVLAANIVYRSLVADGVVVYCPHLSAGTRMFADERHEIHDPGTCSECQGVQWISEDTWLALGLEFIKRATHILMLPYWELSVGSQAEHKFAQELGKQIFYDEDSLRASLRIRPRVQPSDLST